MLGSFPLHAVAAIVPAPGAPESSEPRPDLSGPLDRLLDAPGPSRASTGRADARSSPDQLDGTDLAHVLDDYVRGLAERGVPPERMLVLVKAAVREGTPAELDTHTARALLDAAVRRSIAAFYAD